MGRPHKECFGCSYCRARGKYEEKEYLTPPSEINPLFNTIPVVINIFYGDPFLYMEDTLECLKRLESSNHKGSGGHHNERTHVGRYVLKDFH